MKISINFLGRHFDLTTEHSSSSCGMPVLVGENGRTIGPRDMVVLYDHKYSGGYIVFHGYIRGRKLSDKQADFTARYFGISYSLQGQ